MSQNQYPIPAQTGYTIFTKTACPYCVMAKNLLKDENPQVLECDEYLFSPQTKEHFLQYIQNLTGKSYRTFPMVFKDGVFIGGYTDTKEWYQLEKAFTNEIADF
jgi:glutaredoxin